MLSLWQSRHTHCCVYHTYFVARELDAEYYPVVEHGARLLPRRFLDGHFDSVILPEPKRIGLGMSV